MKIADWFTKNQLAFFMPIFGKRKIASTLTFLGGCFAATDI